MKTPPHIVKQQDRERGALVWLQAALAGGPVKVIPVAMTTVCVELRMRGLIAYDMEAGATLTDQGRKALETKNKDLHGSPSPRPSPDQQ